jgi:hypothetical protein
MQRTICALLGGALGTALGLRTAMVVTTAGVPLAALILLCSPVRACRDLPVSAVTRRDVLGSEEVGGRTGVVGLHGASRPGDAGCRRSG